MGEFISQLAAVWGKFMSSQQKVILVDRVAIFSAPWHDEVWPACQMAQTSAFPALKFSFFWGRWGRQAF
jgi:hypothetical protein